MGNITKLILTMIVPNVLLLLPCLECAICGERKSYAVYEETFNTEYDIACTIKTLEDKGFCSKLEFKLDDYERRKDEEERLNGES